MHLFLPFALVFLIPAAGAGSCVPVLGPSVRAVDLATVIPAFSALPEDQIVAPAPRPGVRRFLKPTEIERLAERLGLSVAAPSGLCLERGAQTLAREAVHAALVRAWTDAGGSSEARIEVLDYSRMRVPDGEIEFGRFPTPTSAECRSTGSVTWRGRLKYDGNQSVAVWASIRITASQEMLVFQRDLAAGAILTAASVASEQIPCGIPPAGTIRDQADVLGRQLRSAVRKGGPIRPYQLTAVREIGRGEVVVVRIHGLNNIQIRAVAVTGGRLGDTVILQNPINGARFQASVDGRREASVPKENPRAARH